MKKRHSSRRIAIYNHKGGVGKTILTANIASIIASLGKKVLIIDSDPQCNLTSYLVEDSVVDDLLDHSDDEDGQTIWSAVKPIVDATGPVSKISPIKRGKNLFLLPGDIQLSEFEIVLSEMWNECFQRRPRGFRGVSALSILVNHICEQHHIDYVFYDSGPNIGSLNRVILLDCDYFIVPVACDLFSVRALKTLGHTLAKWIKDWQTIVNLAPDEIYLIPGKPTLLGYIPQRFRTYGGELSSGYTNYLSKIERNINSEIVTPLRKIDHALAPGSMRDLKLGQIKDFGTLANAAQTQGVSIWEVAAGTPAQREQAKDAFKSLASRIIALTS